MPDRVIDAWVWIGKGLVDEERYGDAQAALEKALSLDADTAQQTGTQFPIYMEKRYIKGGPLQRDARELAESLYRHVLMEQSIQEKKGSLDR